MTTTTDIQQQLRLLTDRTTVTELLHHYQHSLDQGPFDTAWAAAFYTVEARIEVPVGTAEGRDEIAHRTASGVGLFARTQHLAQNYVIDIKGDRATARANVVNIHVTHGESSPEELFVSGGWNDYELLRTPDGWRIHRQSTHLTWTRGEPPHIPPAR